MIGTSVGRDASGAPLIDASGSYTSNNDTNYKTNKYALIGDSNPDFIANVATRLHMEMFHLISYLTLLLVVICTQVI